MTEQFQPTGHTQEVTPHRQEVAMAALEAARETYARNRVHLWIVVVVHRASEGLLDGHDQDRAELRILDADTMAGPPAIACYICEQTYDKRIRFKRCPGEPR